MGRNGYVSGQGLIRCGRWKKDLETEMVTSKKMTEEEKNYFHK